LKNYYQILGVDQQASELDIRRAFRQLVKKFHPDINPGKDAKERFIEIQEAYECLSNPQERRYYDVLSRRINIDEALQHKRDEAYKKWVEHQQRQAKFRHVKQRQYDAQGKETTRSPFVIGVNFIYNILFLFLFLVVAVIPIWSYYHQFDTPAEDRRPLIAFLIPSSLGALFLCLGYYYWFILKTDKY
jgi:DnaJ domain